MTYSRLLHLQREEVSRIGLIIAIAIFLDISVIPNIPFVSDESVYVYASYAIMRGTIPYREIYLPHPPLIFYIYAFLIKLLGPNIYCLRLCVSAIYLSTGFLIYLLAKAILKEWNKCCKLGLICMCLYLFYPAQIPNFLTCIVEPIFTLFTLASVIFYILYAYSRRNVLLVFTGILLGLSLITKLTAILFIASIFAYHIAVHWRSKRLLDLVFIILGLAIPITLTLIWIVGWCHALRHFYLDMYYWPMVRIPPLLAEKFFNLTWYAESFLPLLLTGALGAIFSVWKVKSEGNSLLLLPSWLYGSISIPLIFLTPSYFHYFLCLTPYLVFLSVTFFNEFYSILKETTSKLNQKINFVSLSTLCFIIFLISLLTFNLSLQYIPSFEIFSENPTNTVERLSGEYIASITEPRDKIWTSEGAIAFFARRLIVAPNSTDWPLQAFFSDALAHRWWTYAGDEMKDYKLGLATPKQFIEAWKEENVKVIVVIRGRVGYPWIPYPDEILWNGYCGLEGVASYVQKHYELRKVITSPKVSHVYEIWVKKE